MRSLVHADTRGRETVMHYHSDLSGDVRIIVSDGNIPHPAILAEASIPGEALLHLVAAYVTTRRIAELEEASVQSVLGLSDNRSAGGRDD